MTLRLALEVSLHQRRIDDALFHHHLWHTRRLRRPCLHVLLVVLSEVPLVSVRHNKIYIQ